MFVYFIPTIFSSCCSSLSNFFCQEFSWKYRSEMERQDEVVVMVAGVTLEDVCVCWGCWCVCEPVRSTGALAVSEKKAASICGRLIGQLGTVSMWHAAVNLLPFSHCLALSFSLLSLSAVVFITIRSVSSTFYCFSFFFFPCFNLFTIFFLWAALFYFSLCFHPSEQKTKKTKTQHISSLTLSSLFP